MKPITREMIKIYKLNDFDFMGYRLIKTNATFHHIIKSEDGGKETLDNGAVLMPVSHQYLHIIEYKEFSIYDAINKIMMICNKKGVIEKEDLIIINELLKMFEEDYIKKDSKRGKKLIKHQYLERIYYNYHY